MPLSGSRSICILASTDAWVCISSSLNLVHTCNYNFHSEFVSIQRGEYFLQVMYSVVNICWWLLPQGFGTNYVVVALFIKSGAWVAKLALRLCK